MRRNVAPRKRCHIVLRTNGSLDNGGGHSLTLVRQTSCQNPAWILQDGGGEVGNPETCLLLFPK